MATRYIIDCANSTDKSYYFCVYQTFPRSPGLRSVAWQVRGVPPKGQTPSTADVEWDMTYGVSFVNWHKYNGTYTGEQIVTAQLGKTYEVVLTEGTIPAINPIPISTETDSGLIGFKNNTNRPLDKGLYHRRKSDSGAERVWLQVRRSFSTCTPPTTSLVTVACKRGSSWTPWLPFRQWR